MRRTKARKTFGVRPDAAATVGKISLFGKTKKFRRDEGKSSKN